MGIMSPASIRMNADARFSIGEAETREVATVILTADDAVSEAQFGFSIAADGCWLAIGAKKADAGGNRLGAVYVYRREAGSDQWRFSQKLIPDRNDDQGEFGEAVAVQGAQILVGSRSALSSMGQRTGAAYLYQWQGSAKGWILAKHLEPSDGNNGDEFGRAVALGPDRLLVGSRFAAGSNGENCGAVYAYQRIADGWRQQGKIVDRGGKAGDQFGRAMAYDFRSGGQLVVGSRKAGIGGEKGPGKVMIYTEEEGQWVSIQQLSAEDGAPGDYFGQSVAVSGDQLVVGARDAAGENGPGTGAVYMYRRRAADGLWQLTAKLSPSDGRAKAQYGFAVALAQGNGDRLAVTARRSDSAAGRKTGAVYLYGLDLASGAWNLSSVLAPDTLLPEEGFGQSVVMDPLAGARLLIGADRSPSTGLAKAGAVYQVTPRN